MKKVKITTVCEIQVGKTPSRYNDSYWGRGSPWLSIADMNQGLILEKTKETITEKAIKECNCKLIPQNTVLFSFKLSIGKVGIAKIPIYTNEAIAAFIIKDHSKLDTKFLFYALKSVDHSIGSNKAVMGKTLNKEQLKKIEIPLPSLEDQKRIVKILDVADALRQKRKQAITLLDDYLKSVFLEMFGDPSTNPKGWERKKIGDYFLVQGGFAFKSSDYRQNGIKLVKIANVHFEDLTWDPIEYVSEQLLERQSEFLLKQNDFLIALTRPIIQSLGVVKTATVKQDDLPCLLNQRVARFKAKKISLNPEFLKYFCYSPFFKRMVEYYSTSALQPNISTKEVEEILIFNPPKELQNHFSAIARKTESIKQKMLIQSQELETSFQALMQKAFRGEL